MVRLTLSRNKLLKEVFPIISVTLPQWSNPKHRLYSQKAKRFLSIFKKIKKKYLFILKRT